MKAESLYGLYVEELKDLYDAENQLLKALPKLIEASSSVFLKDSLSVHFDETRDQAARLEGLFNDLQIQIKGKTCEAMQGLIKEAQRAIHDNEEGPVRDAAIIAAAQRVEHYEIAGYGTLRTFANHLGRDRAVEVLQKSLNEEKSADEKLTQIAESGINVEALGV